MTAHSLLTENDQPLRGTYVLRDAGRVLHVDPDLAEHMEGIEVMSMVGAIAQVVGMAIVLTVFGWVLLALFLSMVPA